jgi:hypothetical protein
LIISGTNIKVIKERSDVRILNSNPILWISLIVSFTLFVDISGSYAQPGPSFSVSYDLFPFQKLTDPDPGTFEQDLEIRIATFSAEFSLAPIIRSEGRTVLVNTLAYHRFDLDYTNWDDAQGGNRIENTQGISYTAVLVRELSEKWGLTAVVAPGLFSDFKDELSYDDFNLQGAVVFGRKYSQSFSLGFGAAYSLKFGEAFPLPLLTLLWTGESGWKTDLFLPMRAELWYGPNPKVEFGLTARLGGGQYHGSPERYAAGNPQMRYSVATVGPSLKLHQSKGLHLIVDGGATLLRRFEFFDGDTKENSLDLKNSGFVRVGIQFGG